MKHNRTVLVAKKMKHLLILEQLGVIILKDKEIPLIDKFPQERNIFTSAFQF